MSIKARREFMEIADLKALVKATEEAVSSAKRLHPPSRAIAELAQDFLALHYACKRLLEEEEEGRVHRKRNFLDWLRWQA